MSDTPICLKERARVRAVILGHTGAMRAIAEHFKTTTDDKRVRAMWEVIRKGTPNHARVQALCEAFRLPLAQAGFWFTRDEAVWRRIAVQAVETECAA